MKMQKKNSFGRAATLSGLLLTAVLLFGGCKSPTSAGNGNEGNNGNSGGNGNTPRTTVPAELRGAWYSGTVSSIHFYDRNNGSWGNPSGTGLGFEFKAAGDYEKGVLLRSSLYNCSMTFFAFNSGTMTVEGNKIVLYVNYGRIKSYDTCVQANNYEKPDEVKTETVLWELGQDEFGNEVLRLRYPDGNPSTFHRR